MVPDLLEAWRASNRANLMLIESIEPDALEIASRSRARTVADQFAHLHNVRLMWLETAKPELIGEMKKIGKGDVEGKEALTAALEESTEAIAELLADGFERGKVRGFKPNAAGFFAYMIAHEAHHRGQIMLTLKLAGHGVSQEIQYGIWDWGKL